MMEDYNQKILKLSQDGENANCVDCGAANPQWASLTFRTYICMPCASVHRGFGVLISRVRSVNMDNWTESMYNSMEAGGNAAFKQNLKDLNLENSDKNTIYRNHKLQDIYKQTAQDNTQPPKSNVSYDFMKNRNLKRKPINPDLSLQDRLVSSFWSVSSFVKDKALIIKDKGMQIGQDLHNNYISPTAASLKEKAMELSNKNYKKQGAEKKPQVSSKQVTIPNSQNKTNDSAKWD